MYRPINIHCHLSEKRYITRKVSLKTLPILVLILALTLAACGGGSSPTDLTPAATETYTLPAMPTATPVPALKSLGFLVGDLPDATVSESYPGYSFCSPQPKTGLFCGGPLADNPATSNPTGGTPHYTFSHGLGLPFGLTLNFNGVLTGTPAVNTPTGLRRFDVCATDQAGNKLCQRAEIMVNPPPAVSTPTPPPDTPTPPPPTDTPTPTPVPQPVEASLTSLTCLDREPLFAGSDIILYPGGFIITGTVSGPVGTTMFGSSAATTSDWTETDIAGFFKRGPNDPATTEWRDQSGYGVTGGINLSIQIAGNYPNGRIYTFNWTETCPN